jgi:hypothetical protein
VKAIHLIGGWGFFIMVQLVSIVLTVVGLVLIPILLAFDLTYPQLAPWKPLWAGPTWKRPLVHNFKGGRLTWLWSNDEDGIDGQGKYNAFVWSALRNPVNNLKFVTALKGGPYFYEEVKGFYFKAGFDPYTGFPVCSGGRA